MHAWIDCELIEQLDEIFLTGKNYEIHNFMVVPFIDKYKCFEGDKQIILTSMTIVTKVEERYSLIPENFFLFTNLKRIAEAEEHDNNLIGTTFDEI